MNANKTETQIKELTDTVKQLEARLGKLLDSFVESELVETNNPLPCDVGLVCVDNASGLMAYKQSIVTLIEKPWAKLCFGICSEPPIPELVVFVDSEAHGCFVFDEGMDEGYLALVYASFGIPNTFDPQTIHYIPRKDMDSFFIENGYVRIAAQHDRLGLPLPPRLTHDAATRIDKDEWIHFLTIRG